MPQHVVVTEYDAGWPREFERESEQLARVFGSNLAAIHHIGSTSVPGLAAKPVVDIMPVVYSLEAVDFSRAGFEALGYEYLGEFGIPGRRYMRKGGDERTHQVHVFAQGDEVNITRHLAFRDYLKTHPEVKNEYAVLKLRLAEKYPYDIDAYCDGKDAFVKKYELEALKWLERGSAWITRL